MTSLLSMLDRFEQAAVTYETSTDKADRDELHAARRAIMEAFEAQSASAEPVAWLDRAANGSIAHVLLSERAANDFRLSGHKLEPLYASPPASKREAELTDWRYSINYGPDGEENWANLITPEGDHVANIRTHHAMRIVAAISAPMEREAELIAENQELEFLLNEGGTWEAQLSKAEARADAAEAREAELVKALHESVKQLDTIIADGTPTDWTAWRDDLRAAIHPSLEQEPAK